MIAELAFPGRTTAENDGKRKVEEQTGISSILYRRKYRAIQKDKLSTHV